MITQCIRSHATEVGGECRDGEGRGGGGGGQVRGGGGGCGGRGYWTELAAVVSCTELHTLRPRGFLAPSSFLQALPELVTPLKGHWHFFYIFLIIFLLLISAQLFTDAVSVLRKVWVLIILRASLSGTFLQNRCLEFDSELRFPAPSSKTIAWSLTPRFAFRHLPATLCQNWLCQ